MPAVTATTPNRPSSAQSVRNETVRPPTPTTSTPTPALLSENPSFPPVRRSSTSSSSSSSRPRSNAPSIRSQHGETSPGVMPMNDLSQTPPLFNAPQHHAPQDLTPNVPDDHLSTASSESDHAQPGPLEGPLAGKPSFRAVNPFFFSKINKGKLTARLPPDIEGCVAHMLNSMRTTENGADVAQLKALAQTQAQVLRDHHITTREQFVDLLASVQWRDQGTAVLHGMASANGFNVGSAIVDFKVGDQVLEGMLAALGKDTPAAWSGLATGAALGLMLSILDAGSGAAAAKTFENAYFTRPPEDKLPAPLQGANPHSKKSFATDLTIAAGASYGGLRNTARVINAAAAGTHGTPDQRILGDNMLDVVGGSTLGGGGMRAIRNSLEIGDGRAGFQHFLARSDLAECLDHLNKPAHQQIASALTNVPLYAKNVATTLPQALQDVLASKLGWTSHAILTPGFGALFSMLVGMPEALVNHGHSKQNAALYTQLAKFAGLQALYHLWGGALGAVAMPSAQADPSQA